MPEMTPSQAAIETMVLEHGPYLQRLARALVGDLHRADDLVAETWAAALSATQASGIGAASIREPRGWLTTVLRRRARHAYRSGAVRDSQAMGEEPAAAAGDQMTVAAQMERERLLHGALEALDEPYRTALFLRYREGLPPREIAERTGAPVKTVNSRLARGLDKLRDQLELTYGGGEEGRRAWLSALMPLAVIKPRSAALLAPSKLLLSAAALVVAGGAGALWMGRPSAPMPEASASPSQPVLASLAGGEASRAVAALAPEAPGALSREPVLTPSVQSSELHGYDVRFLGETGAPLADEEVLMIAVAREGRPAGYFTSRTNGEGVASFDWAGTRWLTFSNAAGTAKLDTERDVETMNEPLAEPMELEVRATAGVAVDVTVKDASGAAVPGALVHATPDAGGNLMSTVVAACDVSGQCRVTVAARTTLQVMTPDRAPSERLKVHRLAEGSPGVRDASFTIGDAGTPLSGRVVNAEGEPVPHAWIYAAKEDIFLPGAAPGTSRILAPLSTRVEADGSYRLPGHLHPGAYSISAFADGYAAQTLRVEPGDEPATANFTLGAGATVRGRVLLADGTPVERSYVRYSKASAADEWLRDAPSHGVSTDAEGRYELFHVPAEALVIRAGTGKDLSPCRAAAPCTVPLSGTREVNLTLSFDPRISGRVIDEAGLPVSGLIVEAELGHSTRYTWRLFTKEDGTFDLTGLPEPHELESADATWTLKFSKEGSSPRPILASVSGLQAGTTDVEVVMARPVEASSYITGRFVRSDGPISPAVKIFLAGAETYGALGELDVHPTDGSFTYGPVGAGIYRFYLDDPNAESVGLLGMEVAAGETLDVGIVDLSRGGHVALTIEAAMPEGVPQSLLPDLLKDQTIVLVGPGGHKVWLRLKNGVFSSEGPLEPGEWKLVRERGERLVLPATTVTIEPRTTEELTLVARVGRPLTARVLMPTGSPWESAALRIYGSDGVQLETSEARTPADLDGEERLELEVEAPIETVRAVLLIDGEETSHELSVEVPFFTETFDPVAIDAR